jgi:hypothetical protein
MFTWALFDSAGTETGTTESFGSQADAEAWFGANWEGLASDGTADVALRNTEDGSEVYKMSLAAE